MKYLKLIIAIVVTVVVSIISYSLIITAPKKHITMDLANVDTVDEVNPLNETDHSSIETDLTLRDSIVQYALKYLGTPYVYGSCSKDGFDCSGFVYFVYRNFNIEVPRSSSEYKTFGKTISIDSVKKGDILVFLSPTRNEIGHLGIVTIPAGMETEFIHATSGKEMMVVISSLKQEGYKRRFVKAIRVL